MVSFCQVFAERLQRNVLLTFYGDEPLYNEYGHIKFVEVPMKCAGGSFTNS